MDLAPATTPTPRARECPGPVAPVARGLDPGPAVPRKALLAVTARDAELKSAAGNVLLRAISVRLVRVETVPIRG